MFEHITEQGSPYEGVLKEASIDFDNLNQALRSLAASIEDHINNLTQGKKPEEVLEFFEKYEEEIVVGAYHRFKTNDNLFYYRTSLEDIKDIREFIYTYILPEPEVNIDFLQKDMRELERLQEILHEAQDRELLLAYALYQGNIEEQQEKKHHISEWKASIKVLKEKIAELRQKEKLAYDLLYEARKAAEDNTDNKEMLSLERENESNIEEHKRLVSETAIFQDLVQQLNLLKKRLNSVGIICDWDDIEADKEYSVDEKVKEIKKNIE